MPAVVTAPWRWLTTRPARGLWLGLLLVTSLRLLYAREALGGDEGGFLMIARQWPGPGHWLYGSQWVDRPPVLLLAFKLAAVLGGSPVALRLLALALALVVVACCWWAGRTIAGADGAVAAALTSAALAGDGFIILGNQLSSDLLGAAFVALSVALLATALTRPPGRATLLLAGGAGTAAAMAVLSKQSALTALAVAGVLFLLDLRRSWRLAACFAGGAAVPVGATVLWAATGPGLGMLVNALFTFRVRSAEVMARLTPHEAVGREHWFAWAFVASGLVAVLLVVLADALGRRQDHRIRIAVLVATGCLVLSTEASLNWYRYYLQAAIPVAAIGLAVAFRPGGRWGARRLPLKAAVAVAVGAALVAVPMSPYNTGIHVESRFIAAAAHPGDTMTVYWGQPVFIEEAGLRTPYPYSWSLPVRVEDPRLRLFDRLLAGPHAPTWLLGIAPLRLWHLGTPQARQVLRQHYRLVAHLCGHRIWLHDGVQRDTSAALARIRPVDCRAGVA